MKTPVHIAASVSYGAAAAGFAGADAGYASVVVAAVAGGAVIDIVDHPLFHLATHRDDPHVASVRRELRAHGLRAAWRLASRYEEERAYRPLFFHRLTWLLAIAVIGALLALGTRCSAELMAFLGALLLHMICDIVGDVAAVGHAENWLTGRNGRWIRNRISRWGSISALALSAFVFACLAVITLRLGVAVAGHEDVVIVTAMVHSSAWLDYLPVGVLTVYFSALAMLILLSGRIYVHRYKPEPLAQRLCFSVGSLSRLRRFARPGGPQSRQEFERLLLFVQADQAPWTLLVATAIAGAISVLSLLGLDSEMAVFLIPVVMAIIFNTLVHSTIGQLGGSVGAVAGWWLNVALARLGLVHLWGPEYALVVAAAAAGSWLFGLLSGMLLRGRVRMSAACFVATVRESAPGTIADIDLAQLLTKVVDDGHTQARELLGDARILSRKAAHKSRLDGIVVGAVDRHDSSSGSVCRVFGVDRYNPFLRETDFIIDKALGGEEAGHTTPVLPRQRMRNRSRIEAEFTSTADGYQSRGREGELQELAAGPARERLAEGVTKSWSEIVDHFNTRYTDLCTDAFAQVDPESGTATVWGTTREVTSTKEYGTLEAEVYASSILDALESQLPLLEACATRVHYPRASIFDLDQSSGLSEGPVYMSQLGSSDRRVVSLSLDALERTTSNRITTAVAAASARTTVILLIQLVLGTVLGAFGIQRL